MEVERSRGSLRWSSELPLPPENQSYDDPDDGPDGDPDDDPDDGPDYDHDDDHDDPDDDPDVGACQQNPTMTNSQFPLWENAGQVRCYQQFPPCKYQCKYAN